MTPTPQQAAPEGGPPPAPEVDEMLEPLIYAAMMHSGRPKTIDDFVQAAANVADMLKRRAQPAVAPEPLTEQDRKDAERYRFIRDADRSDCITRELSLYAMDSLDEYVDAAMEGEAALAVSGGKNQPEAAKLTPAARDVLTERQRQISVEGLTPGHDDFLHHSGDLSHAAAMYAIYGNVSYHGPGNPPSDWPWHVSWWKPATSHRRNLVKAGALILAEIERLDRAALAASSGKEAGHV